MSQNEKGPSIEKMRRYRRFEELVTGDDPMALRSEDGNIRRRKELSDFFKTFFRDYLQMSKEEVDAAIGEFGDLFEQRIDLMKQRKEVGKPTKEVMEKHAEIDEAFIQRMQKVIAEHKEKKEQNENTPDNTDSKEEKDQLNSTGQLDKNIADALKAKEDEDAFSIDVPSNPREISGTEFHKLLSWQEGTEYLRDRLKERTEEMDRLCERKGLKKNDIAALLQKEGSGASVGWETHQRNKKSITEYLKRVDGLGATPDSTVANSFHGLWVQWFENSDKIWELVDAYEPGGEEKKTDEDEKKTGAEGGEGDGNGQPPTDGSEDKTSSEGAHRPEPDGVDKKETEDEYTWREGIEEFSGDAAFRKEVEDLLDRLYTDINENFPNPEALPRLDEYHEIGELVKATKSELVAGEEWSGMYGQQVEVEYSAEDKVSIQEKVDRIKSLKRELYEKFDQAVAAEDAEGGKPVSETVEDKDAYKKAYEEWKKAREEWKNVRDNYETELQEYYENLRGRNVVTKGIKTLGAALGISPSPKRMPENVARLSAEYIDARKQYTRALAARLAHRKANRKEVATELDFENENVKAAAANRFVMDAVKRRREIQDRVYVPSERVARVRALFRRSKTARIIGSVALATAAGATVGGIGALVAGGARLTGIGIGAKAAAGASAGVAMAFVPSIMGRETAVEQKEEGVRKGFDIEKIGDDEKAVQEQHDRLDRIKRLQKISSIGAGAVAGVAVGGGVSNSLDVADSVDTADTAVVSPEDGDEQTASVIEQQASEATREDGAASDVPIHTEQQAGPSVENREPQPMVDDHRSEGTNSWGGLTKEEPQPMADDHRSEGTNSWGGVIDEEKLATETDAKSGAVPTQEPYTGPGVDEELVAESQRGADGVTEKETATEAHGSYTGPGVDEELIAESQKGDEVAPESIGLYEVQGGDSLWNILEGKGPDANPVGGQSEILKELTLEERNVVLDRLIEQLEGNEELTRSVGIVESGDPHKIMPGEHLDIPALEKMIDGIARGEGYLSDSASTEAAEQVAQTNENAQQSEQQPGPDDGLRGDETPQPDTEIPPRDEPVQRSDEYPMDDSPPPDINQVSPEFILTENKAAFVNEHLGESQPGGFFGLLASSPNAYDVLHDVKMETLPEMANGEYTNKGVSDDQWEKLSDMIEEMRQTTPIRPEERLDEYMDRFIAENSSGQPVNTSNIA